MSEVQAVLWSPAPGRVAACRLCPHRCDVAPGGLGRCRVRQNLGGVLYATNYEEYARLELRPIEEVPFARFRPGSRFLAIGAFGDSFPPELAAPAATAGRSGESRWGPAHEAIDIAVAKGAAGLACAGGEPFMWLEQWGELAAAARAEGLLNAAVTNGFALPEAVAEVAPLLDAVNLSFLGTDEAYRRRAGTGRAPVLETARALRDRGVHIEMTYLVLAGPDEPESAFDEVARVARDLGAAALHVASPLHLHTAATVRAVTRGADLLRERFEPIVVSGVYRHGT